MTRFLCLADYDGALDRAAKQEQLALFAADAVRVRLRAERDELDPEQRDNVEAVADVLRDVINDVVASLSVPAAAEDFVRAVIRDCMATNGLEIECAAARRLPSYL